MRADFPEILRRNPNNPQSFGFLVGEKERASSERSALQAKDVLCVRAWAGVGNTPWVIRLNETIIISLVWKSIL